MGLIFIFNKILILFFFMSMLNIVRHGYYFIQAWVKSDTENPSKYIIGKTSLILLCVSIGYVLTVIYDGLNII